MDPRFLRVTPGRCAPRSSCCAAPATSSSRSRAGRQRPALPARRRPGLVALTFDDGWADNHGALLPILREYGITATIYVTTGLMGRPNPWLAPDSGVRAGTGVAWSRTGGAGWTTARGAGGVTGLTLSLDLLLSGSLLKSAISYPGDVRIVVGIE
jgi:hypothetical protein